MCLRAFYLFLTLKLCFVCFQGSFRFFFAKFYLHVCFSEAIIEFEIIACVIDLVHFVVLNGLEFELILLEFLNVFMHSLV